ncbi:probable RNA polymerase II nuclear localization protein SLC7A6OS [Adelges cooleyi]|uniref:probable RNA polymerase II nuclear localization protein SLC7A6OS n=1 Tax=Adelges cooleyi TaxID=133065 RepID=UPI00218039C6|nr:probable RNA polymerase II nuclear localization protein SLC7A6OS [Adelges cooleyi]
MALVRVKRRHNEDPFNSVVISHKKLKTNGAQNCDCVFQFAGTVKDTNEGLSQILKEAREGRSVKDLTKTHKNKKFTNIIGHSKSERSKIINTLRAVKQDTIPVCSILDGTDTKINVVDVDIINDKVKPSIDEGISIDYVYDLYYAPDTTKELIDIQDIDSVHGLDSDKFYSICEKVDDNEDSSPCEDDDDSNDEGNWRNDYPDEEEIENSDGDYEDLIIGSKQLNMNSCSSSDIEEDDNIEDYDYRYERYKARVKAEENYYYNIIPDTSEESCDSG